jgi:aldose 1-epimerase
MPKKPGTELFWQSGEFYVGVLPRGGAITRLDWVRPDGLEPVPLLRPATPEDIASGNPSALGCFPMVPFTNRLGYAQFEFDGKNITVPANRAPDPHAIHGFGLVEDWTVQARNGASLRLENRHKDHHGTGFDYVAWQELYVEEGTLVWELGVTHLRGAPMPYGIGLHPWFSATDDVEIEFEASDSFGTDEGKLPVAATVIDIGRDFSSAKRARHHRGLDAHYSGWTGEAELRWPERNVKLDISASDIWHNLQLYIPQSGDAVCLEPVSHVPNVHNRVDFKEFGDVTVLGQGASLIGTLRLTPGAI